MEIQNSTNDDAMIRVGGGPGNTPRKDKLPIPSGEWILKPGQTLTISIEVTRKEGKREIKKEVKALKALKLTKVSSDVYDFQVVKNGKA